MKTWKPFNDECTNCGSSDIRVLTSAKQDGWAFEDDIVECLDCKTKGSVVVNEENEGGAYVSWNED